MTNSIFKLIAGTFIAGLLCVNSSVLFANSSEVKSCTSDKLEQCWLAALQLDESGQYEQAVKHYESLCSLDYGRGCRRLGWAYQHGEGVNVDTPRAIDLYTKGCALNDGRACNNLGVMHEEQEIDSASIDQANKLYATACELGEPLGCYNAGFNFLNGYAGTSVNVKQGVSFFTKGCELNAADQCEELADHFDEDQLFEKSFPFYKKACELNSGYGCTRTGWAYDKAEGVKRDLQQANQYYRMACEFDNAAGCNNFGRALMQWDDVDTSLQKNEKRGLELLIRACNGDESQGCTGAGYAYENGIGTDEDYEIANSYYHKGCDGDNPTASSCYNLGYNYQEGLGVDENSAKAKYYFDLACQLGDEDGC